MTNKVVCESLETFAELVAMFTAKGLAFEAFAHSLEIVITGH